MLILPRNAPKGTWRPRFAQTRLQRSPEPLLDLKGWGETGRRKREEEGVRVNREREGYEKEEDGRGGEGGRQREKEGKGREWNAHDHDPCKNLWLHWPQLCNTLAPLPIMSP